MYALAFTIAKAQAVQEKIANIEDRIEIAKDNAVAAIQETRATVEADKQVVRDALRYKANTVSERVEAWKLKLDLDGEEVSYDVENLDGSFNLECDEGFESCGNGHAACCAIEFAPLFEECPRGAVFIDGACWEKARFTTECPVDYTRTGNKCLKTSSQEPEVLCPAGYTLIPDKLECVTPVPQFTPVCPPGSFRVGEGCFEEVELEPTCEEGYTINLEAMTCTREYESECPMRVPKSAKRNLRSLPTVDELEEKIDAELQISQARAIERIQNAVVRVEDAKDAMRAKVDNKRAEIEAAKDRLEDKKLALTAWAATKEHDIAGKAQTVLDKIHNTVVKATCTYVDMVPAVQETVTVPVTPSGEAEAGSKPGFAPASVVCPADFNFDEKDNVCRFFDRQTVQRVCAGGDGKVVKNVCFSEVDVKFYCPKPWTMTEDMEMCEREVTAPGLYTWMRAFECIGDEKYCASLFEYIKH